MATLSPQIAELDAAVIAYVEWHKHAQCVQIAYEWWVGADEADAPMRYAAYIEELDREERACELYAAALAWSRRAGGPRYTRT